MPTYVGRELTAADGSLLKSAEESLPTPIRLSSATETSYYIEMPDEEAPAAPLYPSVPDEFACRICLESDQTPDDPLIAPCRCAGTTKWVHRGCLDEWRASSANARSFHRCDQCGAQYRLQRSPYAPLLESEAVCLAASALLLAAQRDDVIGAVNIGSGRGVDNSQLAAACPDRYVDGDASIRSFSVADPAYAKASLAWQPREDPFEYVSLRRPRV